MQQRNRPRTGRRWGIGQLLVLLVLVVLTPFVLLEVYRGVQDVARRREAITELALGQAQEEAATMADFFRFTERNLATLAADPAVRRLDRPPIDELFQAVRDINPNYVNVFLLSPTGEQIASTSPLVADPDITDKSYFREALAGGGIALSGAVAWQETDNSVVVFARRVTAPDGSVAGVLCIALNLARLSTVIGQVSLPPSSAVVLVQQDGTIIAAGDEPERWLGRTLDGSELFADARELGSGTATAALPDGTTRVIGYQAVERAPWLLLAGIPESEVTAVQRRAVIDVLSLTALAAVATAALLWIVLRRVVVPIDMLADGARAFAAGFLHRRVPLKRNDELGDLADALNSMAAALERRLEEEEAHARALEELNRLQTEFVATASHELRTPVTAIRTYAEALMRPDILDEQSRVECVDGIDRASGRLARLVRALLDVSRIESGQVPVTLGPVDAGAAMRAAAAQAAPEDGDAVRVAVSPKLPPVMADADRLEDVLANLIGNARRFSPPGAPVLVRAHADGGAVQIEVEDRGPGIAEAERERIFDRFYQAQRGAERRQGGAGLGLYIARAYVTAMAGDIRVDGAPGGGSVFRVRLPAAARAHAREGADAAGVTGAARGG